MRIGRSALWGALLGLVVGLVFTAITMFQVDEPELTQGELLVSGLVVAVPLGVIGGFLAGWAWSLLFDQRG